MKTYALLLSACLAFLVSCFSPIPPADEDNPNHAMPAAVAYAIGIWSDQNPAVTNAPPELEELIAEVGPVEETIDPLPVSELLPGALIRGVMLTDAVCDKNIETRKADLTKLRTKYNTVLTLLDLQRNGPKATRTYVDWARTKTALTPLGIKNLKYLKSFGFQVHVVTFNGWGLSNGFSAQMASTQKAGVNETNGYTPALIAQEKAFALALIKNHDDLIDGIMPALETTSPGGVELSFEVAKALRAAGWSEVISYNAIGEGAKVLPKYDFASIATLKACSQNDIKAWTKTNNHIRNSDGMRSLVSSKPADIQFIHANPGPKGFYLWSPELVGGVNGRSVNISDAFILKGGTSTGPITYQNAPAYAAKWYPGVVCYADQGGKIDTEAIWKPISEHQKKLVVILPIFKFGRILSVTVDGVKNTKPFSIANGFRGNYHFPKQGGQYKGNLSVETDKGTLTVKVANPAARTIILNQVK